MTLAVLPFFHIYSMELIMLLNLRLGSKIVTLPKFEPETYLKALVQFPVLYSLCGMLSQSNLCRSLSSRRPRSARL